MSAPAGTTRKLVPVHEESEVDKPAYVTPTAFAIVDSSVMMPSSVDLASRSLLVMEGTAFPLAYAHRLNLMNQWETIKRTIIRLDLLSGS